MSRESERLEDDALDVAENAVRNLVIDQDSERDRWEAVRSAGQTLERLAEEALRALDQDTNPSSAAGAGEG